MAAANNSCPRELTRDEKAAIRKLLTSMCANYDYEYGCLLLESCCYMFGKCWTGSSCRYFRKAVLPLDLVLEAALTGRAVETRPCPICGQHFPVDGKRVYCSEVCEKAALRRQKREYMRKKRLERRNLPR